MAQIQVMTSCCLVASVFTVICCQLLVVLVPEAESKRVRFQYIGCFKDNVGNVRDINGLNNVIQFGNYPTGDISMTWQYCSGICSQGNFAYMGLQHGSECFCGNSYGSQGTSMSCNTPCDGDSALICGAPNANSVFSLTYDYTDGQTFVLTVKSYIAVSNPGSYQLYWNGTATSRISCASLCITDCQAVLYNSHKGICYQLKFALIPSYFTDTSGDFFALQ